jgi:hypothetical protein
LKKIIFNEIAISNKKISPADNQINGLVLWDIIDNYFLLPCAVTERERTQRHKKYQAE